MKIKYIAMFALLANMANATVILTVGNAGTSLNNLLFNGATGTTQTSNTILGTVSGQTANFTDTTEMLTAQGGQAQLNPLDAALNTPLTFSIPGFTFTMIEFNPELTGPTKPAASTLNVTVKGFAGTTAETIPLSVALGNGENRFFLSASGGETIQSVTLSGGLGFSDLKQVRVGALAAGGGGGGVGEPVPEPASFLMLGGGLLAIALTRRHTRA